MLTPVSWLTALNDVLEKTQSRIGASPAGLSDGLAAAGELFRAARERKATAWWVGNGGSCAICSHLAQDVMNKIGLRSHVLAEPSLMTCMANDFGYAEVYARPLRHMARPGDLLVAISSSGNSPNIVACADVAAAKGLSLLTLSAFDKGNKLWNHLSDVALYLPSDLYGLAEVGHEALLHAVIECLWLADQAEKREI
jgi:D-sedoheptulose 7-phosphate isomerase